MTATSSELKRARATELWMIVEKWNWQWPLFKRDFKLWSSKTPRAKPVNEWMNPHFIEVCRVARCWAIEHLLERWKYHRPQSTSNCLTHRSFSQRQLYTSVCMKPISTSLVACIFFKSNEEIKSSLGSRFLCWRFRVNVFETQTHVCNKTSQKHITSRWNYYCSR